MRWWCRSTQLCHRLHRDFTSSGASTEPFKPPPFFPQRRVVVTGLGMVTPLGCGVETTLKRLIEGESGITALSIEDFEENEDVSGRSYKEYQIRCLNNSYIYVRNTPNL